MNDSSIILTIVLTSFILILLWMGFRAISGWVISRKKDKKEYLEELENRTGTILSRLDKIELKLAQVDSATKIMRYFPGPNIGYIRSVPIADVFVSLLKDMGKTLIYKEEGFDIVSIEKENQAFKRANTKWTKKSSK